MMETKRKAILVVSFGTTHEDTRIRSIESIEKRIQESFPEYQFYRAWTSRIIRNILKKRNHIQIDSIEEAFDRMKQDQIEEVLVQPTHVINGFENDEMNAVVAAYRDCFKEIRVGNPLLSSQEDMEAVIEMLKQRWQDIPEDEAVVLMGHGTEHYVNTVYAALDYQLKEKGLSNIYVGTVEAYPSLDTVKGMLGKKEHKKVHLTPFMIVAGDHAKNDMAGEDDDSWKSQLEELGYSVECHLSGLGEYSAIQDLFVDHVRRIV